MANYKRVFASMLGYNNLKTCDILWHTRRLLFLLTGTGRILSLTSCGVSHFSCYYCGFRLTVSLASICVEVLVSFVRCRLPRFIWVHQMSAPDKSTVVVDINDKLGIAPWDKSREQRQVWC